MHSNKSMDGPQRSGGRSEAGDLFPICMSNILRYVHDISTIIAIMNCGNNSLIELATHHINEIDGLQRSGGRSEAGEDIPFDIIVRLKGIKVIRTPMELRTINELAMLATLPNLKCGTFIMPSVTSMAECVDVAAYFIEAYCRVDNRDFKDKRFILKYGRSTIRFVVKDGRALRAYEYLINGPPEQIVKFLRLYIDDQTN